MSLILILLISSLAPANAESLLLSQAARRELERQRQLEWERQRREQLMSEKLREQNQVDQMKSEVGKLKMELETLVSSEHIP